MDFLAETGFDGMRFGNGSALMNVGALPVVLPLLIDVQDKRHIAIRELSRVRVASIVNAAAGCRVVTQSNGDLKHCIRVGLKQRQIDISEDGSSGLRDVILAAVLIRVYNRPNFDRGCTLVALMDEARLTLVDELPQALTYSGTADLHCVRGADAQIVLHTAPQPQFADCTDKVEHIDFHFKVA